MMLGILLHWQIQELGRRLALLREVYSTREVCFRCDRVNNILNACNHKVNGLFLTNTGRDQTTDKSDPTKINRRMLTNAEVTSSMKKEN